MGILKSIGKAFKRIGKGVKKVFKKFGKFMGEIGIVGQIAMMFVLPGIGAALARGFGGLWTGAVGQTAAQATAAANAATAVAGNTATQAAIAGATDVAAGELIKQTALKAATKTAMEGIRAGTTAITQQATGMLASEYAVVKGAGLVLQKGAQFASTIASGYKTVSQAVTGAFTETGKWIGGKLGMKTAEGAAMQGSWANYSKAVTDSFNDFKGNVADFWSPIKDGPTINVGIKELTNEVADATGKAVNSTSNIASATGSELNVDGEFGTGAGAGAAGPSSELNVDGEFGTDVTGSSTPSLLDRTATYITETPDRLYKGAIDFVAQTPGRVLKSEATGALYDAAGLTPEQQVIEEQSRYGGYVPTFGSDPRLAQTLAPVPDFGTQLQSFVVPVNETGYYGSPAIAEYNKRMQSFANPNTGVA